ncbi:unnamed protein product [Callosobruchus maculatus]|uniref:Uncharacterized protein n=1 Tax=Callosobruchus maculatus TaxID=64391 RepID=A0A653DDW6_CALMS|nr:unnamed protein product [Callosobruchus maculatus]
MKITNPARTKAPTLMLASAPGFEPSHHRYYESPLPYRSNGTKTDHRKPESKESRFGIISSSYGNSGPSGSGGGGYGSSVAPVKIDLGGVALGALIGFGAVLIIPKIAHILSGGIGGYRSLEGDMSSVTNVLARIDNSLEQQNIDSSACMQRIICSYVQDAEKNKKSGEMGSIDELVLTLTNNTLLSYVLDGTAVKQAVDLGRSADADKCSSLLPKCAITRENILQVISNILPS